MKKMLKKEGVYQPVANDFNWAVIAERWYGIPLAKSITKDKDEKIIELVKKSCKDLKMWLK